MLSKKQFWNDLKTMECVIEPYIQRALSEDETVAEDGRQNLITSLAQETRDRRHIRDSLMSMLLAGRDTTAGTLSWCFLELTRKPDAVRKLRNEIDEAAGREPPTYQQLKDMKYLNAVVNETRACIQYWSGTSSMRSTIRRYRKVVVRMEHNLWVSQKEHSSPCALFQCTGEQTCILRDR